MGEFCGDDNDDDDDDESDNPSNVPTSLEWAGDAAPSVDSEFSCGTSGSSFHEEKRSFEKLMENRKV